MEKLSSRAQDDDAIRDGVARLDRVRVRVPGAVATERTLSEAAGGGVKSFLLKPLHVFFRDKNRNGGAVLPVSIVGTYPHAKAQLSLTGKR